MALQSKPGLPSNEELILSGNPSMVRRERQLIKLLNTKFSGSIAPLLLLTKPGIRDVDGLGQRFMRLVLDRLEAHDLRLCFTEENAKQRAISIYKGLGNVPIQVLHLYEKNYGFMGYGYSRPVKLLCELDASMTLGELTEMSRGDLRNYLKMKEVAVDSHWFNQFVQELRARLKVWDLTIGSDASKPAKVASGD